MSGHSKWATIKRKKSAIDSERSKVFTKIAKEMQVAVRQGGPDPDGNFRLKLCIQKAKAANMPADNIRRCIDKASGSADAAAIEEFTYEGYGAGGVAVLCSIMTDNRNRVASEVRYIFSRNNGNLGETGCVGWMFSRKGELVVDITGKDEDEFMMVALDAGADDMTSEYDEEEETTTAEVITDPSVLLEVRTAIEQAGYEVKSGEITMKPDNTVEITDVETAAKLMKLIDALEDNDDVQAVYANYDIPDHIMEQLG
ncbi:MAG: YebC/PmpR family DNA-binding transcriptional regulator [Firmicutes bacterium]|nr:YebC/PmpR family DNA-binding transcriptional regulator [Bacillota bacterium]MBQ3111478.1 YebC/PmpR family DNA-binding transcriptional regulator [Bacillota bacterium]MBR4086491.1 YebC/PmpR family DNA-binding transcriptional regulator [Clostridia bacterium]MBR6823931.1 YebC/PmpR family DNA-binding transcriptional regulator [Bacillota bacterium]MBR7113007.1 YebC/PmpR family DNA-binding transcriptional regulator [Bacillota bacterium]